MMGPIQQGLGLRGKNLFSQVLGQTKRLLDISFHKARFVMWCSAKALLYPRLAAPPNFKGLTFVNDNFTRQPGRSHYF